ncbi:MAG: arylsulfatase [Verrucomicrobiae bacterium]|nr:arylsulfatase [Verrucomicrobiae bacterium]
MTVRPHILPVALLSLLGGGLMAAEKPNILLILADDLGYGDVGYHGTEIKTPHIDRLAAGGARLEAFYALPVCTPTRCALLTGRYPIRYGRQFNVLRPASRVGLSLDERLLPEALREAGYATAHCGKWHVGEFDRAYWPMQRGFDHTYGLRADSGQHAHRLSGGGDFQRDEKPCADEGWRTDLLTREAVRLIERRDASKPLFLYLAYHAPHTPLECPPQYSKPHEHLGPTRGVYAGMIAEMDEGIGRVVAAVEKAGIRDNTLIIFASDNGGLTVKGDIARNTPLRAGKGSLYEGGVRVVALANWPGRIPAGLVVNEPLHMVDWFPTLVRLAGAKPDAAKPLDGRDIWPAIAEGRPSPHEHLLLNAVGREGAIRAGPWKLVRNGQSDTGDEDEPSAAKSRREKPRRGRAAPDQLELFNLADDPSETTNLATEQPEKVRELTAILDRFAKEAVPPILKPEQDKNNAR